MTTLPPYTGDTPTCTACGHRSARTEYRALGECIHEDPGGIAIGLNLAPRLHRECERCDYAWDEATITTECAVDTTTLTAALDRASTAEAAVARVRAIKKAPGRSPHNRYANAVDDGWDSALSAVHAALDQPKETS
ncbi:hypothetical protein [Streptomyces jumonjinensis]|uniref:Uncharacterized protein n=1 Tax=Streptomyces jumonjinensis TaxID=1945 RepID=A0A646KP86_STRJU|nr:hypothetical protein [Streptomyces jumonjinensis]MQT03877.1 hypothetical protein [Streptomyces jumonjinensis]